MSRRPENSKWRCLNCYKVVLITEMLKAPSPFDSSETLTGCPHCKSSVDNFECVCDEPGCNEKVVGGFPTNNKNDEFGGYRQTCSEHYKWAGKV